MPDLAEPERAAGSGGAGSLGELAAFFLRLGFTAFGGPAAHIALMEQEAVRRRNWLSHEAFLDLLGACNLIPGPSSTQMAMGIGYRRAGWRGLVLGGACFVLPATAMTLAIAWAYVRYGQLPRAQALLYGIKPVILAFLKADLVDRAHWLTQAQLLDAVAVGQVTPGPVFTTATFIGYLVRGWPGALLATAGIFLPSFLFVGCLGLVLSRLRKSPRAAAFLDGVNAGALALMAAVTWTLSRAAVVDPWTAALGLASAVLLIRFKPNPTWLVLGGGLAGCLVQGLMR